MKARVVAQNELSGYRKYRLFFLADKVERTVPVRRCVFFSVLLSALFQPLFNNVKMRLISAASAKPSEKAVALPQAAPSLSAAA